MLTTISLMALLLDDVTMAFREVQVQTAVDRAALAACQEIEAAFVQAAEDPEYVGVDAKSIVVKNARQVACEMAAKNGVFIDPNIDVVFGKRTYDGLTGTWSIAWNEGPYDSVKVNSRRNNLNFATPAGLLKLAFGWAVEDPRGEIVASATASAWPPDRTVVLDYSGAMNDDRDGNAVSAQAEDDVESAAARSD